MTPAQAYAWHDPTVHDCVDYHDPNPAAMLGLGIDEGGPGEESRWKSSNNVTSRSDVVSYEAPGPNSGTAAPT